MTWVYGGVEVGGFAVPRTLEGWPGFERNLRGAGFQIRSVETICGTPRRNGQGLDSSFKMLLIFIWTRVQNCVALGTVTQYSRFWRFDPSCRIHSQTPPLPISPQEIPGYRRIRVHIHQLNQHLIPLVSWLVFPGEVVQGNVQGVPRC